MGSSAQAKRVGNDLTEGDVLQKLILFVGPIIFANIIQQVYSLVDLMIIGQFVGNVGTVAVSTGGEISDMLTPVATAFASAGQIYIGQLAGAGERRKMREAIGTFLSMMVLMAILTMAVVIGCKNPILSLLNCPEEAFTEAGKYMLLTAVGLPFIFGYNAICGVLRGMGESKWPMVCIMIAAVVNIVLDLILVAVFHLDAAGTAIATTLSEGISFLAASWYMLRNKESFDFEMKASYFALRPEPARKILNLGIPQAIRSLLVRVSMLYVNASVNAYGITASATNSIGNKLQKFLEVFSTSFSQAASAMIAQNIGAQKNDRAAKTVTWSAAICVAVAAVTAVVIVVFPKAVFGIFTNDADVLDMGVAYLQILVIHLFLSAITSTYQSMVIGSGFASLNFVIGILDGIVCKIGLALLFVNVFDMGVYGYFWGTALSRLIPGIINVWYFYSGAWKTRKRLTE